MYYLHRLEVPPWHLLLILTQEVSAHAGRHRKQIAYPDHQHEQADRTYPGDGVHEVPAVLQEQDSGASERKAPGKAVCQAAHRAESGC